MYAGWLSQTITGRERLWIGWPIRVAVLFGTARPLWATRHTVGDNPTILFEFVTLELVLLRLTKSGETTGRRIEAVVDSLRI